MRMFFIVFLLFAALLSGVCWDYMFSSWLPYFDIKHEVPFWVCALLGFVPVIGQLSIPGVVVTWVSFTFILV